MIDVHPVSLQSSVTISDQIAFRDLGGEAVVLNLDSGQYYGLDEVGSRIWALLREARSLDAVHGRIIDEFEVERETAEDDLLRLVTELRDYGLVEIV